MKKLKYIKLFENFNQDKFDINLSKYDFSDISVVSPEIKAICKAAEQELKKITGIQYFSLDHVYDTGTLSEDKSTGNLTLEFSYDVDEEDSFSVTYLFKQQGINSPLFKVIKD